MKKSRPKDKDFLSKKLSCAQKYFKHCNTSDRNAIYIEDVFKKDCSESRHDNGMLNHRFLAPTARGGNLVAED